MPISEKDRDMMRQVAAYFEGTRKAENPGAKYRFKREDTRSINDTAIHFGITRSKVQKMLITMGVLSTPVSTEVRQLRNQGMSIREIAETLGVSVGTVSSNLPYEDEIHGSETPSEHARAMREYRAYERMQKERQEQKKQDARSSTGTGLAIFGLEQSGSGIGSTLKPIEEERKMSDDWKKDLDSRLSFTETDSRRQRVTHEMMEGQFARYGATMEEHGIDLQKDDRDEKRKMLRAKENLTPDEILELGEFPGALMDRNTLDLEELYGERLPYEPQELLRLHVELIANFSEEEKEIMHKYGGMKGETISRDIIVSDDLPLYALHFVIQRAFGFNNAHLHRFTMSQENVEKFTKSIEQWKDQVGVIYRSPFMEEDAEFWADDYEGGSFKNWLRKKYTGPCVSQCWGEGVITSRKSMKRVNLNAKYYVEYGVFPDAEDPSGETARPFRCQPVYEWDGRKNRKNPPPEPLKHVKNYRVEFKSLRELPLSILNQLFPGSAFNILERLSIGEVLAARNMHLTDAFRHGEEPSTYQQMLDDDLEDEVKEILADEVDSPMDQPCVSSFTDELLYQYDFYDCGDEWKFRITASLNCADLVESGTITQDQLDKSNIKARVTYRPVLIARDGEMLIEEIGGYHGMVDFIRKINTMQRGERDEFGRSVTQLKDRATSQGWHKDDSADYNLL